MIEITISVRLVQTAVEITKVVARKGDGAFRARKEGAKRAGRQAVSKFAQRLAEAIRKAAFVK